MNVILWNCQGTSSKGFVNLLKYISSRYRVHLMVLMETHISGEKARKLISKFGVDGYHVQGGEGFSGGIWVMWRMHLWKVEIIESWWQYVHMKVTFGNDKSWFLTAIYGSPHSCYRRDL